MTRASFAHFPAARQVRRLGLATVVALAGCASLPPPTAELDTARVAVERAQQADADQYAAEMIARARAELEQAQAEAARGREDKARSAAVAAAADADFARIQSEAAVLAADRRQRLAELARLRQRLQLAEAGEDDGPDLLGLPPGSGSPGERLRALEADPRLNPYAQYERLQARQAIAALEAAGRRDQAAALALAQRRVEIAEQAARIEATRRALARLDRERADLLLEASRRDAERARAEAERLRLEAQVQAEEAARLRAQAQQAEAALDGAQQAQDARASAARQKELALARQEAELVAGAKLPPVRTAADGSEVYTLAGDAFASGQATLTPGAAASVRALGTYLARIGAPAVEVVGHSDDQGKPQANLQLSQRRAAAVREALVAAGLPRGQVQARGVGAADPVASNATAAGRAQNRRVEIRVAPGG
ncbi:OmpA family protein [Thermomonas flagellata]|uniref:OmpA family protein n=1 Tax=Thermomonas flagellata TaxID=2888524 RepID=UPI001F0371CE|nr:OmpA family protein [Thermomonas flagellata]